jgi:hypothetical protein
VRYLSARFEGAGGSGLQRHYQVVLLPCYGLGCVRETGGNAVSGREEGLGMNEQAWSEMLLERQAKLQKQLRAARREIQHTRDGRDMWRKRAKEAERITDGSLRAEIVRLEARLREREKQLEQARFLNEVARMNAKRREANRETGQARRPERETAAA